MKKIKILILATFILLITLQYKLNGQISPIYDYNYVNDTALSDEFNGTQINTLKWHIYNYDGCCNGAGVYFSSSLASEDSGYLKLEATNSDGLLTTSGIESLNNSYLYGYYEMRAKLPGYFNTLTNSPCSQGFWTSFWTYYHVQTENPLCTVAHNEIDIQESSGLNGSGWGAGIDNNANIVESHCWGNPSNCSAILSDVSSLSNLPPLYANFHKFAAEYLSNRMIFYFDDVPFAIYYGQTFNPTYSMKVVMDNQLQALSTFNSNTPWPMYYTIDYFHYYQLNTTNCSTNLYIKNNAQLANFWRPGSAGVLSNITIGDGTDPVSLTAGVTYVFRAVNSVTINGNFTMGSGSSLNIIPTPCD